MDESSGGCSWMLNELKAFVSQHFEPFWNRDPYLHQYRDSLIPIASFRILPNGEPISQPVAQSLRDLAIRKSGQD